MAELSAFAEEPDLREAPIAVYGVHDVALDVHEVRARLVGIVPLC